jgi:hypothetical protein
VMLSTLTPSAQVMAAMNDGDAGRSPRSTLRSSEYDTLARVANECWLAPWILRSWAIRKPTQYPTEHGLCVKSCAGFWWPSWSPRADRRQEPQTGPGRTGSLGPARRRPGLPTWRRSTATSWRRIRISTSLAAALRASNLSQSNTLTEIRYTSRNSLACDHGLSVETKEVQVTVRVTVFARYRDNATDMPNSP